MLGCKIFCMNGSLQPMFARQPLRFHAVGMNDEDAAQQCKAVDHKATEGVSAVALWDLVSSAHPGHLDTFDLDVVSTCASVGGIVGPGSLGAGTTGAADATAGQSRSASRSCRPE